MIADTRIAALLHRSDLHARKVYASSALVCCVAASTLILAVLALAPALLGVTLCITALALTTVLILVRRAVQTYYRTLVDPVLATAASSTLIVLAQQCDNPLVWRRCIELLDDRGDYPQTWQDRAQCRNLLQTVKRRMQGIMLLGGCGGLLISTVGVGLALAGVGGELRALGDQVEVWDRLAVLVVFAVGWTMGLISGGVWLAERLAKVVAVEQLVEQVQQLEPAERAVVRTTVETVKWDYGVAMQHVIDDALVLLRAQDEGGTRAAPATGRTIRLTKS